MSKQDTPPSRWKPINFGWKYWNYAIIGVGLIVGFCVWALPNRWAEPDVVKNLSEISALQRQAKIWKAEQAEIERQKAEEIERLGLVYIEPGTNPFLPDAEPVPPPPPQPDVQQ